MISMTRIMTVTTVLLTVSFLKREGFKSNPKSRGVNPLYLDRELFPQQGGARELNARSPILLLDVPGTTLKPNMLRMSLFLWYTALLARPDRMDGALSLRTLQVRRSIFKTFLDLTGSY